MKISATHVLNNNKVISKAKFIEIYTQKFKLNSDDITKEIALLKKIFKLKFTQLGPVIITKLYNSRPEFCWGEYAILVNIYGLDECMAIGGTDPFDGNEPYCIHPNIHVNFGEDEFTGYRICLGYYNTTPIYKLIKSGLITAACDTIVSILNNTDPSDDLFYDFKNIHFNECKYCGEAIDAKDTTCKQCIKSEQDDNEEEIYS